MLTIAEVVKKLQRAITFQPKSTIRLTLVKDFNKGPLYNKIQKHIHTRKGQIYFDDFVYLSCEIDGLTGNEFLRLYIDILNDERYLKSGNCILFSLDKENCVASMIFEKDAVVLTTLSPTRKEDVGIFSFVVNDAYARHCQEQGFPYNEEKVKKDRTQIAQGLTKFFHQEISKTEVLFRYVYFGLVDDIAKTHIYIDDEISREVNFRDVPVAACISLAVDSGQLGKLQQVFGMHGLDTKAWIRELELEMQEKESRKPTEKEKKIYVKRKKLRLKMEAAKSIIAKSGLRSREPHYYEEDVEEQIRKIKQLYQI